MSLINQALKKAQQDRINGPESAATAGDRPAGYTPQTVGPAQTLPFTLVKYVMGSFIVLAAIGAAIIFMLTQPRDADPIIEATASNPALANSQAVAASKAQPPRIPATPLAVASEPPSAPSAALAVAANGAETPGASPQAPPTPVVASPQPHAAPNAVLQPQALQQPNVTIRPPAEQPVLVDSQAPAHAELKPTTTAKAVPNANVIAFLEAARVTGVRIAGSQSKVVMNNRVFRVNSIVDTNTNLTVSKIFNNEIQFVDESGLQYRKQF